MGIEHINNSDTDGSCSTTTNAATVEEREFCSKHRNNSCLQVRVTTNSTTSMTEESLKLKKYK
ncbi:hypothetical protein C0J52_09031 [Blattella germanica]|nr:hypothetical protein C0J52_09031 [Blattella germanica]